MDLRYPKITDITVNSDVRGFHTKFFGSNPESIAIPNFAVVEVFMTINHKNVVRGLHYQSPGQSKIIQVITGSIVGNILCCNPDLPEFGQAVNFNLTCDSAEKIYVPPDWAQGYRALEENTRVLYMAGTDFDPSASGIGVDPFDTALNLDWGEVLTERIEAFSNKPIVHRRPFTRNDAIVAERDKNLNTFEKFSTLLFELKDRTI